MTLPPGFAFEGDDVVPVQPEPQEFYDDVKRRDGDEAMAEILRGICELLADGPPKSAGLNVAALRRVAGHDARPLREVASEIGCSVSTVHAAVEAIKAKLAKLKPNKLSEVKRP